MLQFASYAFPVKGIKNQHQHSGGISQFPFKIKWIFVCLTCSQFNIRRDFGAELVAPMAVAKLLSHQNVQIVKNAMFYIVSA